MRNQKGITMVSLVIYVLSFAIIIGIIGSVTAFFSSGMREMNQNAGASSEYNKFNIYMSKYTKNGYNIIPDEYENNQYIAFEKDGEKIVFEKVDDILYVDNVKLCENVDEFEAKAITTENGKDMLKTKIKINGVVYTTDYVIESPEVPEEPVEESTSLISALVDDLGTRSTIYLYNNTDKITEGTIAITMPDESTATITALDDTTNISSSNNYTTYTVSKNGEYTFTATAGDETTETTIKIKNIETFTPIERITGLNYAGNDTKAYSYKEAAVPKGYFVDTNTKVTTGLVITDAIDEEGYSTGNEWVWVPVNSAVGNDDFYIEIEEEGNLAGAETVSYSKYSKLYSFLNKTREDYGTFHPYGTTAGTFGTPAGTGGYRELAILTDTSYGETGKYNLINQRGTETKFTNVADVATQYVNDYNNMVQSVDIYKGFYIGRYEITENGEMPGKVLTNTNWYNFYNQCMTYGKEYTESGMIYGALWDATMQWLAISDYSVGFTGYTTSGYGNYKKEAVVLNDNNSKITVKPIEMGRKLQTGETSYTRSNNIYDLSGNCGEWTHETILTSRRVLRGADYNYDDSNYTYASTRSSHYPTFSNGIYSTRPQICIKVD